MGNNLFYSLMVLTGRIPFVLILIIGLVLALRRMRQYRKPMTLIAWGCGLQLLNSIAGQVAVPLLASNISGASFRNIAGLISLITGLLSAIGIGLILAGAFTDRKVEDRGFAVIVDQGN